MGNVILLSGLQLQTNWDIPLPESIIENCHRCNDFIVTNLKHEIALFMLDHYGKDGIRKCAIQDDINP
jgi:hypothetical protein